MATPAHDAATRPPSSRGGTRQAAADQSSEVAGHARGAAADVKDTALERAGEVTHEAMDQARNLLDEARSQLDMHASAQAQQLGRSIRRLAEELQDMGRHGDTGSPAGRLVEEAAELSHQAADFFDGREFTEIIDDVRAFARRRPTGFLLGAAGLGILVGRLARGTRDVQKPGDRPALPAGQMSTGVGYPEAEAGFVAPPPIGTGGLTEETATTRRTTAAGAATGTTARRTTAAGGQASTAEPARTTVTRATARTKSEPYPAEPMPSATGTGMPVDRRGGRR